MVIKLTREIISKLIDFESFVHISMGFLGDDISEDLYRAALKSATVEEYLEGREILLDTISGAMIGVSARVNEDLTWEIDGEGLLDNMKSKDEFEDSLKDLLKTAGLKTKQE